VYYIHKYEVALQYGGAEEGGWWFDSGVPTQPNEAIYETSDEDEAYALCRKLNEREEERAAAEEKYDYTSVLSYESTHYEYRVTESAKAEAFPLVRPHYE
jgi:hypothetical protein